MKKKEKWEVKFDKEFAGNTSDVYDWLALKREIKSFIRQTISQEVKEAVERVKLEIPKRGVWQFFPQKDNPVRCRLCDEKVYCSCFEGYMYARDKLNQKIKELEGGK